MKKIQKGGFTLIELLMVMVILAILAAVMVPSMTGYIDKAKNQSRLTNARAAYVAAQSAVSEYYMTLSQNETLPNVVSSNDRDDAEGSINDIMEQLLGPEFEGSYVFRIEDNQVTAIEYTSGDGEVITIPEEKDIE